MTKLTPTTPYEDVMRQHCHQSSFVVGRFTIVLTCSLLTLHLRARTHCVAGDGIAEELKRAADLFATSRLEHGQPQPVQTSL